MAVYLFFKITCCIRLVSNTLQHLITAKMTETICFQHRQNIFQKWSFVLLSKFQNMRLFVQPSLVGSEESGNNTSKGLSSSFISEFMLSTVCSFFHQASLNPTKERELLSLLPPTMIKIWHDCDTDEVMIYLMLYLFINKSSACWSKPRVPQRASCSQKSLFMLGKAGIRELVEWRTRIKTKLT